MKVRMTVEQQNVDEFLNRVIEKYHFKTEDRENLRDVYEQMMLCVGPYASYRINQRMTGIHLIDDSQSAIVAMTLGIGVDRLADKFMKSGQISEAYMLDSLANELMLGMYGEFNKVYARFHRRYVQRYVFIGNEIPLTSIPGLLEEIKGKQLRKDKSTSDDEETVPKDAAGEDTILKTALEGDIPVESNEITANECGVLLPSKSVVFYAILSENPSVVCEGVCMNCSNQNCENRLSCKAQNDLGVVGPGNTQNEEEISDRAKSNLNYGFQRIFGS